MLSLCPLAAADKWLPVSAADLAMKEYPAAPGAHAIILYKEVSGDGAEFIEENYVRIKIFTEQGREYGNITIPYLRNNSSILGVEARTIRPDGSIVRFEGQVFDKLLVKQRNLKVWAKTFSLPEVQPGCIIEYRYTERIDDNILHAVRWDLQEELFVRQARFSLRPYRGRVSGIKGARLRYLVKGLPPDRGVQNKGNLLSLEVENLPAFEEEPYMPPEPVLKRWILFYYGDEDEATPEQFWVRAGQSWFKDAEAFIGGSGGVAQEVARIAPVGETPDARLHKLYTRVQQIRNLTYEPSTAASRKEQEKLKAAPVAHAGAPDWLRALARETLPTYPPETEAVVLLEDEVTTIQPDGEIKTRYRKAYKILRPGGRSYGTMAVYFDNETRLTFLKGWSIPVRGEEYEVKEKDAIETAPFDGILYQDTRLKHLIIPAAESGSVVGYEYEQRHRPYVLQDSWRFQESIPVRLSRFTLQLPAGWEYKALWRNHPTQEPREAGANQWTWELRDFPGVEDEPSMPAWQAVAGRMNLKFFPRDPALQGKVQDSWNDIGRWYAQLASTRRSPSPDIQKKVKELTAGLTDTVAKIRALASFAQRDVRYVAIEIGIGGYQPHAAPEIFANRYGDCKDKATLLSVMLREIGVESYYVVVHTKRGVAAPEFPSMLSFNHVILALRFPPELSPVNLHAFYEHPRLGRLLFFDPTDNITPLGYIPSYLQNGYGLLVGDADGELVRLPLLPPHVNRLEREAKFRLLPQRDALGRCAGDLLRLLRHRPTRPNAGRAAAGARQGCGRIPGRLPPQLRSAQSLGCGS